MSASLSVGARPAAAKRPTTIARISVAVWDTVVRYFVRRTTVATLRELDDRALRDIGIVRPEIEAAVHGFITLPDRARMS
jgi:uncharacterized protein YjiS (DUF1127 family)